MIVDPRSAPVRFSNLKRLAISPRAYLHSISTRSVSTRAMRLGTLVHAAVLGARFDDDEREIVYFDGLDRRGKIWTDFRDAHPNAEIFTAAERMEAAPIAAAVKGDRIVADLIARSATEQIVHWSIGDRACRSTLDMRGRCGSFIADLKTTTDATPRAFLHQSLRLGYHAQLAMYQDAACTIGGMARDCHLIAACTREPYEVVTYRVSDELLDAGRRLYRGWFERLLVCEASDQWPGIAQTIVQMDAPEWMQINQITEDDNDDQ